MAESREAEQRNELSRYGKQLEEARREAASWNREVQALEKIVAGFKELAGVRPSVKGIGQTVFEEIVPPAEDMPPSLAAEDEDPESASFRAAIYSVVAGHKRGIALSNVVAAAETLNLKTEAASFQAAVRYAISALKVQGKIRSAKRGVYKAITSSRPVQNETAPELALAPSQ